MLAPGDLLDGRYRLVERIATGGMGEVWRAIDEELGRTVAVKALHAELGEDAGIGERFRGEARAMGGLSHDGVAAVYDYGETSLPERPDVAYIVMACVAGQPLSELIEQAGRLQPVETMSVVGQAARALQAVHSGGVVHRDVKPANLVVEPDGHVVLIDFGVALTIGAVSMTDADVVVGTALYIAPEQVTKEPISPAADIYALGAVAYHCLAGHPPFLGDTALEVAMRHVDDDVPPLPDDVPAAAREFVAIALTKDPAKRFASAAAMAEAAARVVEALPDHSAADFCGLVRAAASAPPPAVRNSRRWRGLVATVAAGVAALAVVLAMRDPAGERPRPIAPPPTSAPTAGLPGGPVDPTGTGTRSGSARTAGPADRSSTMVAVPGTSVMSR